MGIITKTIIKTFVTSFIVFYFTYIIVIGVSLVKGIIINENSNLSFNLFSSAVIFSPILMVPVCLIYGFFYTMILSILSLLDKRVLNRRFVIGSIFYLLFMSFIFKDLQLPNMWFSIGFILISLIILLLMNIKKLKIKFKSRFSNSKDLSRK